MYNKCGPIVSKHMNALAECVDKAARTLTTAAEKCHRREDLAEDPDEYRRKAALVREQFRSFREGLDDDAAESLLAAAQDVLGIVCHSLWTEAVHRYEDRFQHYMRQGSAWALDTLGRSLSGRP